MHKKKKFEYRWKDERLESVVIKMIRNWVHVQYIFSCTRWSVRTLLVRQKMERIGFCWDIPARGGIVGHSEHISRGHLGGPIFDWVSYSLLMHNWLDVCRHQVSTSLRARRDTLDTSGQATPLPILKAQIEGDNRNMGCWQKSYKWWQVRKTSAACTRLGTTWVNSQWWQLVTWQLKKGLANLQCCRS